MSGPFDQFIARGKSLADHHGLVWDPTYDSASGKIFKNEWWDLSAAAGKVERPRKVISSYAAAASVRDAIGSILDRQVAVVMTEPWIAFFKAVAVHDIFENGRTPGNFANNISDSLRILAICAGDTPPPLVNSSIVSAAYNAALITCPSAKRASTLKALIANWLDRTGIADQRPLAQYCTPDVQNALAVERQAKVITTARRQSDSKRPNALRSELSQKHYAEKLPDDPALIELIRIVFTKDAETFTDFIRFRQARVLLATGLRVGELVSLPHDCLVIQEPELPARASVLGPHLPIVLLKHFAEKQTEVGRDLELVNAVQHVPPLLVPTVTASVSTVLAATAPLRRMVEGQRLSGSLFPDLDRNHLIPWTDAYTRLSGMIRIAVEDVPAALKKAYRRSYDVAGLIPIREQQRRASFSSGTSSRVRDYYRNIEKALGGRSLLRDAEGSEVRLAKRERIAHGLYVRVGEMEDYARTYLRTKVPDLRSSQAAVGRVGVEDRLFLYPGRALAEAKHDAIIDVERYFSVQTSSRQDVEMQLGDRSNGGRLFQRYGTSDAARSHAINPHSLRHLQTTELFRLGVADTIITKRFNRRSTAQSYVYDHRTLADHLDEMEPKHARLADQLLAPNARKAFDLIRGGKIRGPVVEAFKRVQRDDGDEAAFEYLNAEAGALHFTPYGFCLNSFAASPCVKHLECFNSCSHLVRTQSVEEQSALETLKGRYEIHIQRLKDRPSQAPNFAAQLAHAEERLAGVRAALAQSPGQAVFENGDDHYATGGDLHRA